MTKVKICGITNLEDALLSAGFGVDALGFNFYEKSPRYISPEKARGITDRLPEGVLKVGVFANEQLDKIIETAEIARLDAIQLHGDESTEFISRMRDRTNVKIIKALRVTPEFEPEESVGYDADAILLDAFSPDELGGTGDTFDWKIAARVSAMIPRLYLAGGLKPENVYTAIEAVRPYAVDACSGLEAGKGKKDPGKVEMFIQNIRNAR
jgi:phosphoribosylanthranilate isomerase